MEIATAYRNSISHNIIEARQKLTFFSFLVTFFFFRRSTKKKKVTKEYKVHNLNVKKISLY
jgi:hypothetical protein